MLVPTMNVRSGNGTTFPVVGAGADDALVVVAAEVVGLGLGVGVGIAAVEPQLDAIRAIAMSGAAARIVTRTR